jgi:hypothetical protein
MRLRDEWSQDVVLRAMSESVGRLCSQDGTPDFVLATGDLAFSGRPEEYELVGRFLDAIINPALNYMKLKHGCGKVRPWLKKTVAERPRTRVSSCASKR